MKEVFLLIDDSNNVVAIYETKDIAEVVKKPLEDKFKVNLKIVKRGVNLPIDYVGVYE